MPIASAANPSFHPMHRSGGALNGAAQRSCRVLLRDQLPVDLDHGAIVNVEATTAARQAEVTAAKRMIERAHDRFGLWPERLTADTRYAVRSPKAHPQARSTAITRSLRCPRRVQPHRSAPAYPIKCHELSTREPRHPKAKHLCSGVPAAALDPLENAMGSRRTLKVIIMTDTLRRLSGLWRNPPFSQRERTGGSAPTSTRRTPAPHRSACLRGEPVSRPLGQAWRVDFGLSASEHGVMLKPAHDARRCCCRGLNLSRRNDVKLAIASIVALGVITAPAIAQTTSGTAKTTNTMMTNHHKSTATKTSASEEKGESAAQEAKERHHARHHYKRHHQHRRVATTTKTIVTKGRKSTAVTTVTTKVKPNTPPKG